MAHSIHRLGSRIAPFAAFFLSGVSSLVFETVWTRMLHHVFGATSMAVTTVLTGFMAGLGLGAWLGGRWAHRIARPLMTYAFIELAIALIALALPALFAVDGPLAWANGQLADGRWTQTGFGLTVGRFLCVAPVLLVPTTLMGMTLPLLTSHTVRASAGVSVPSNVGLLYAINTTGAVLGVFLTAFVLLPSFGVRVTHAVAVFINVVLFAGVFLASLRSGASREPSAATTPLRSQRRRSTRWLSRRTSARWLALGTFTASGFIALGYEVVWTRAVALVIGSSVQSFALILISFLLGIASGSAVSAAILGRLRTRLRALTVFCCVTSALAALPLAVRFDGWLWLLVTSFLCALIAGAAWAEGRNRRTLVAIDASGGFDTGPSLRFAAFVLVVPVMVAAVIATAAGDLLPKMTLTLVCVLVATVGVLTCLTRSAATALAAVQLLTALATFVAYAWQDEVPRTFASLLSTIRDLRTGVGKAQAFMFLCAGISTVASTFALGTAFPLCLRLWNARRAEAAADVGVLYAGNTAGSIVGAWAAGFVLMPWIGLERIIAFGMGLNLVVALIATFVVGVRPVRAFFGRDRRIEMTGYVLAAAVPLAGACLYYSVAEPHSWARWNRAHMTLGVFRVSLVTEALHPERWADADLLYYKDGLSTTVTVERWGRHLSLKNNGKVDASNGGDMATQIMVGAYPLIFAPQAPSGPDVAIVGFGSGVTVGAVLQFPVHSVTVLELEPAIPEASRWFESVNQLRYGSRAFPFVQMPKLRVVNDDGRNFLARTERRFDVIVSEPSNPWITGVSDLFTEDHFRMAKRRLKRGGIYCQWVQLYELSPANVKTIYRTFANEFPHMVAFAADAQSSDTILLGSLEPLTFSVPRYDDLARLPSARLALLNAGVRGPGDIAGRLLFANRNEVLGYSQIEHRREHDVVREVPESLNASPCTLPGCWRVPAPLNTDDNALIEFSAPRDLIGFAGYEGYYNRLYGRDWPYGRVESLPMRWSQGTSADTYAEFAMALLRYGKLLEAKRVVRRVANQAASPATRLARRVIDLFDRVQCEPAVGLDSVLASSPSLLRAPEAAPLRTALREGNPLAALGLLGHWKALRRVTPAVAEFLTGYASYGVTKSEKNEDALVALDRAVELGLPEPNPVHYFRSRLQWNAQRYEAAIRSMTAFAKANPDACFSGSGSD